jgi:hypothetical protein
MHPIRPAFYAVSVLSCGGRAAHRWWCEVREGTEVGLLLPPSSGYTQVGTTPGLVFQAMLSGVHVDLAVVLLTRTSGLHASILWVQNRNRLAWLRYVTHRAQRRRKPSGIADLPTTLDLRGKASSSGGALEVSPTEVSSTEIPAAPVTAAPVAAAVVSGIEG